MKPELELLGDVPYFASLDGASLAGLLARGHRRHFQTDDMVMLDGEPCEGLCVVVQGRLKVCKTSADGREQSLRILGPGRTCNEVAVVDGGANNGTIVALEPASVLILPAVVVRELMAGHPQVALDMAVVMAGRIRALTDIIEDMALRDVVARVAKLLLDCSRGVNPYIEGQEGLCHRITHQELASMTGTVRDVVQRALKTLERDGAIRMERAHVRVVNKEALARWGRVELSDRLTGKPGKRPGQPKCEHELSMPRQPAPDGGKGRAKVRGSATD